MAVHNHANKKSCGPAENRTPTPRMQTEYTTIMLQAQVRSR